MTDWADWLSCPQCPALLGGACFTLSSGGPEALPARYADVPHSGRKRRGATATRTATARLGPQTSPVVRRTAKRQASTAKSWADVARRQGKA